MKQAQEQQQASLQSALGEKKATASDYETQIANVRAQADEYRSLIEQQNAELQKIQEEKARQAEEAKKAEEAQKKHRRRQLRKQSRKQRMMLRKRHRPEPAQT